MREFPRSPITALIDDVPRFNLGESCGRDLALTEIITPEEIGALGDLTVGYGTSRGNAGLRDQIGARLGVPADQVLITAGAASALFLVGLLFSDGEIVVGLPCYPPTLDTLQGIGASVRTVTSRFDDLYRIDIEALRTALSVRTTLVIFASPQNPSATSIPEADIAAILEVMAEACPDAWLLVDETFREASYGDTSPRPTLAGASQRIITCASLSKAYGVPGLRIGWLTAPDPELYDQLRIAKFNAAISCGTVDEFVAHRVLSNADKILAPRGDALAAARDKVENWVDSHSEMVRWLRPEAGAFCCLELSPAVFDANGIKRFHGMLEQASLSVAPGTWFGDSAHVIRVGLTYEPLDRLEMGLSVLGDALALAAAR